MGESSDDEIEIFIFLDGKKETFNIEDANDPDKVKQRFDLDYEPSCVYKMGKKKTCRIW